MKQFNVDVDYNAIVTERIIVTATDKEDAKRKILDGNIDDIIDTFIDTGEVIDFNFYEKEEYE